MGSNRQDSIGWSSGSYQLLASQGHSAYDAERTIVRNPVLFDGHLVLLEMITGIDGIVILEVVGNDGQVVNFWVTTLFSSSLKFDGSTFCESSVLSSEQSRNSTV